MTEIDEELKKLIEEKGTAEYFTSGKWLDRVKQMPENEGYPARGAILVTISGIKKLA